jgi:predicted kinase
MRSDASSAQTHPHSRHPMPVLSIPARLSVPLCPRRDAAAVQRQLHLLLRESSTTTAVKDRPSLIVVGGSAGSGKTTIAKRLSSELVIPCLGSDTLGRAIRESESFQGSGTDAYRIGYAVLWRLCEEFVRSGVSVIVDTNMGWDLSWQAVDAIRGRCPEIVFLPTILSCPRAVCLERINQRHVSDPRRRPGEWFTQGEANAFWTILPGFAVLTSA